MTTDPIALLRDAENYLSALHGSVARHDHLAANLACAGCELRDRIAAALPELAAVSSAVVAPRTDQTTAEAALAAVETALGDTLTADAREEALARIAAVLPAPADQAAPAVWVDGHPLLEAIAAAVWEQCRRSDSGTCLDDDPRNIAVAALSAVRNTATDLAAENKRLRAKVFEWQGSYLDEVKVRQERDAEIARLRADRAAVLREAADRIDATRADFPIAVQNGITWATAEMRRHAADEQPGARHVHITIHHPDPTTANTAALCIADLVRGEYGDSHRLTITTDAPGTGAAPHRPADETPDTLAAWLYQRFMVQGVGWDDLDEGDRTYWEHHARAVRRAVARGGFKQPAAGARQDGAAS